MNDEFLMDDLDDDKTVEFIRNFLPVELKEKFTDDDLYYIIDVIADYYFSSGLLDAKPDADGCVEIDTEKVKSIQKMAQIQKTLGNVADAANSIGQAFNSIEDPAAKVAGTVAAAIATIALGYASATKYADKPQILTIRFLYFLGFFFAAINYFLHYITTMVKMVNTSLIDG